MAIADEGIPIPDHRRRSSRGRFNKGVDYVGDVAKFSEEFSDDIAAIAFAVANYGLPSTHEIEASTRVAINFRFTEADEGRCYCKFDAGEFHIKTAG